MEKDYFGDSKFVTELEPSDFDDVASWKLKKHRCSIVLFYAPWCPHCKMMKDVWNNLGETAAFFDVCAYNCEKNSSHLENIRNDLPELVRGYPTMVVYERGSPVENVGETQDGRTVGKLVESCMRACKSTS